MKKKKNVMIAAVTAVVFCVLAVSIFIATTDSPEGKLAEQLELGQKYLEELDYENAIVAYQAAIEIDPRQEEAYLGLAQAYEAMGDYQAAVDILQQGVAATEPEKLEEELARLRRRLAAGIIRQLEDGTYSVYVYDEDGNLVSVTYYNADNTKSHSEEYDGSGRKTSEIHYDLEGGGWMLIEFGNDGLTMKESHYFADGTLDFYLLSEYDRERNMTKEAHCSADGTIEFYIYYEWGGEGEEPKVTYYNADGTPRNME